VIVLVTGATGGFGQVLSRVLHDNGLTVYGTSRHPQQHQAQSPVPLLALDVASQASADACIRALVTREGRVDVVINCVNEMFIAATEEQDVDEVARLYETNVFGVMRVCKAVLPYLRRQASGLVINMSSLGGLLAVPHMGAYTSAKFALEAMTEALYHEVRNDNIDVVIMQPVAMHMDRPATGGHLRLGQGVGADSFAHEMVALLARDTKASKLTPEAVAARVLKVIRQKKRPLRVPMDRAVVLGKVKRLLPQKGIDRLIHGLVAHANT